MSTVLQDVAALLLAFGIVAVLLGGAALLTALWVRRLWRRKRGLLILQAQSLAVASGAAGLKWLWTRPLPDRRWWTLHKARRRLHRSLEGAERAVAEATAAHASVGDLPSLCQRLRVVATDVDRSLVIAQQSSGAGVRLEVVEAQVTELIRAGEEIQRAAAISLTSANDPVARSLADHVRLEIQAIAAGATT